MPPYFIIGIGNKTTIWYGLVWFGMCDVHTRNHEWPTDVWAHTD